MSDNEFNFKTIGVVKSPFMEKFGIPRQPRLTPDIRSSIVLEKEYASIDIVDALEQSSHLLILFVFSECVNKGWKNKIRPPRLGGNKKIGVFASRSPFRPNPIGMSAVKLLAIKHRQHRVIIDVLGADLMNGTPVIDIKPYIPYSDSIHEASNTLAESFSPLEQPIFFSSQAQRICEQHIKANDESLSLAIEQILRCDPRPAYQQHQQREYGIALYTYNIRWQINNDRIDVINIDHQS